MSTVARLLAAVVVATMLTAGSCGNRTDSPPTVTPGAFCDREGAQGVTESGTPMVCKGPGELRWRRS